MTIKIRNLLLLALNSIYLNIHAQDTIVLNQRLYHYGLDMVSIENRDYYLVFDGNWITITKACKPNIGQSHCPVDSFYFKGEKLWYVFEGRKIQVNKLLKGKNCMHLMSRKEVYGDIADPNDSMMNRSFFVEIDSIFHVNIVNDSILVHYKTYQENHFGKSISTELLFEGYSYYDPLFKRVGKDEQNTKAQTTYIIKKASDVSKNKLLEFYKTIKIKPIYIIKL